MTDNSSFLAFLSSRLYPEMVGWLSVMIILKWVLSSGNPGVCLTVPTGRGPRGLSWSCPPLYNLHPTWRLDSRHQQPECWLLYINNLTYRLRLRGLLLYLIQSPQQCIFHQNFPCQAPSLSSNRSQVILSFLIQSIKCCRVRITIWRALPSLTITCMNSLGSNLFENRNTYQTI